MKRTTADSKLRERVKELKCLYELSKIAWQKESDVEAIVYKTLDILPQALKYPTIAEVYIRLEHDEFTTAKFRMCKWFIDAPLHVGKKKYGLIKVGYRPNASLRGIRNPFLPEEKNLLRIVSRELSLYVQRASIEDDKQKLQLQLQHAERLAFVGKLSAGIAHELNEPLGRILGFAQLIKKESKLNEQHTGDIERIIRASLYSREIIKKLMLFSRQMPRQLVGINVNEVIKNVLTFIDMRYQTNEIKIISKLEKKIPNIQADPVQISQVIVNLLTNAIYAMDKGGDLVISTQRKENVIRIVVKDTGHGMTADVKKKIFEPFFTTKPVGHGTGLGLSVVHGIILEHQGSIRVKSTPGKGTTFEILFPIKSKRQRNNEQ